MTLEAPHDLLKESHWISQALDAANTGLWVITLDTRTGQGALLCDSVMMNLVGVDESISPEDCFTFWRSRIDKRHDDEVNAAVGRLLADRTMHEVRYPYHHPTRGSLYVRCGGRRVSADGDPMVRLTGYHQDVSEVHAVHQSLRESLSQLSQACRLGNLGVFELRFSGGALQLTGNGIFYAQFGLSEDMSAEERATLVRDRAHPDDVVRLSLLMRPEDWTTGLSDSAEARTYHPERGLRWVKVAFEVMGEGDNCRVTGYTSDVTAQRMHEQVLREAKEAAEAANAAKSEFLANTSHEIRTPMSAVMGMAYLTLNTDLSSKQRDYVEKIHKTCVSLLDIINELLDFSKIEAGRMDLESLPFRVANEMESVLALLASSAEGKGLKLICDIDPAVPTVLMGDALRLRQILLNLGSNAVKFSDRGMVRFSARVLEQSATSVRLAFSVHDEGIGMSEAEQARLFTPFAQADSSIFRRYGGTGLGLAFCRSLAALMAGGISVSSAPGQGSVFTVELPFEVACESDLPLPVLDVEEDFSSLKGLTILVAEDGEINLEIMEALLLDVGAHCLPVRNGRQALDAWMQHGASIDVALLDVRMPVMDGYATTRSIRESGIAGAADLPIIAMTAYAMRSDMERSFAAGMNAHLTKPLDVKEFYRTLVQYARGRK